MAQKNEIRKSIDLPIDAMAALKKEAVDSDITVKDYIEQILVNKAKQSKYYGKNGQ